MDDMKDKTDDSVGILYGLGNGAVRLSNISTGYMIKQYGNYQSIIMCLCTLSIDSFAVGNNGNIEIWHTDSICLTKVLPGSKTVRNIIKISSHLLVSSQDDMTLKCWDYQQSTCIKVLYGHNSLIQALVLISENKIASGSNDHTIKIWDLETWCCDDNIIDHECVIYSLCSLDNNQFCAGDSKGLIKVFKVETYEILNIINVNVNKGVSNILKLSKYLLASSYQDNTIKIIDYINGVLIKTLTGHNNTIRKIAKISQYQIVSISFDKTIKIWNIKSGKFERTIQTEDDIWSLDLIQI